MQVFPQTLNLCYYFLFLFHRIVLYIKITAAVKNVYISLSNPYHENLSYNSEQTRPIQSKNMYLHIASYFVAAFTGYVL